MIAMLVSCSALLYACAEGEPDHPQTTSAVLSASAADAGLSEMALLPTHLPCEIETLVRARCRNCHVPLPNRPVPLQTYADFTRPSKSMPNLSYAQQAQQLVQSGMMPPASALGPAELQQFSAWVQAGAPTAECGAVAAAGLDAGLGSSLDAGLGIPDAGVRGPDAFVGAGAVDASLPDDAWNTRTTCTSNKRWTGGEMRSELMHPGRACIDCHTAGTGLLNLQHGPSFTLAGTLFPSAHEPDDCNGAAGTGVSIVVTGANGQTVSLTPNSVGNFHSATRVTLPYTVELHYQGRVRSMTTPQTLGDCNSCHTEEGKSGAPGRIKLP